jgi:Baseplate J-like protein
VIYQCCDEKRKAAVLGNPSLNCIDYLEVLGFDAEPLGLQPQTVLMVRCLKAAPTGLSPSNVIIAGGESITNIAATFLTPANTASGSSLWPARMTLTQRNYFNSLPGASQILVIGTSTAGDFSPYTLRLVNSAAQAQEDPFKVTEVLTGFDPQLAEVEFYFKVECPPFFDCKPQPPDCPPDLPAPPAIRYLAKDYASFRTIILDRLSQLLPAWGATSEADLGIALAELIAYVGDRLSYKQDAVATEAFIETARSRVSLRRHALLVDYHIHDGCNARVWMQLHVNLPVDLKTGTRFFTSAPAIPTPLAGNERAALDGGMIIFESMQNAQLFPEHDEMSFYTWGEADCCLPKGATEATLLGTFDKLQVGDVLIFQEMVGPQTNNTADADMRHRCAVRLTNVAARDAAGNTLVDPLFENGTGNPITSAAQQPTPVTEIEWSTDDALPFPVCISSKYLDPTQTEKTIVVSKVFGNVVLTDHGCSFTSIDLKPRIVPRPGIFMPPGPTADRCNPTSPVSIPVRYRPLVPDSPITQAVSLELAGSPVTPGIVHLLTNSFVTLTDAKGLIALTVQAASPLTWPDLFGVVARQNTVNPANFDLSIVYNHSGMTAPPVVETITDLSLAPADPNFVVTKVNAQSGFLNVPVPPPGPAPAGFPGTPTTLASGATTDLKDIGGTPYLTIAPKNPATWPPLFGVLTQDDISDPSKFNLLVVYAPTSGGVGVLTPVVLEQFTGLDLDHVAAGTAASKLVTVKSFEDEPNLALSAYDLMHYDANTATPVITLTSILDADQKTWTAQQDLLADGPTDTDFVVEIESDGTARLRFGDNVNGLRPDPDTSFTAAYRIGNGTAGNVGADTLIHCDDANVAKCTNPLAATGGVDPETTDQIRRRAPQAFMTQQRAITMPDYVRVAEMNAQVEDAVATLRWTGSWYTVFITAEPKGAGNLTTGLRKELKKTINRYRLAGQDLELESPQYVSLLIALTVCVDPAYFRSDVGKALSEKLGSRILFDGTKGLFYPDNFTFGQTVYLSRVYAAARKVAGVQSVVASVFQPQAAPPTLTFLANGEISLGPFQIARLDNDPSLPDHGQLTLSMQGGR